MIYGSVDEKATKVKKNEVLIHRYEITGATPDGNVVTNFNANIFNARFSAYVEQQQGLWNGSSKYWKPTDLRVYRLTFNPNWCGMIVYYSFSTDNYYRYSTIVNLTVDDFVAECLNWGVTINKNKLTAGKDVFMPLQSQIISTDRKPVKIMYGSSGGRTKTIYK